MSTTPHPTPSPRWGRAVFLVAALGLIAWPTPAWSARAPQRSNPIGKVFFADVSGEAHIDAGNNIQDLTKRSIYRATGSVIETDRSAIGTASTKSYSTLVYSNGTGAFIDRDTHVEVRKFEQDRFNPNRTDMDIEPSISQTEVFISHGTVALSASTLVAGSTMIYETPHCTVNVRGRKIVIETTDEGTIITMLEGESTVQAGPLDFGGHILKAGEQLVIRASGAGQASVVELRPIPMADLRMLVDRVDTASMAKKTVYFEVKERPIEVTSAAVPTEKAASTETKDASADTETAPTATASAETASADTTSGSDNAATASRVTAFDGAVANSGFANAVAPTRQEIVPVAVVPVDLPVQFTVSPSRLITR